MTTWATPGGPSATERAATRLDRWYGWADAAAYVGLLNLLIIAFTLAGGVVLGWAPALAAAASCSRTRLRGDTQRLVRAFATRWRRDFLHANLLVAPTAAALTGLGLGLLTADGPRALQIGLWAAAAACVAHLVLVLNMDAHYELRRVQCALLAWTFLVRFPGAPLLLIATTALTTALCAFVPGLVPVVAVGTWTHLCTALCLSFFAANDRNVAA
ncbi:DUF624 domain-containing protein [Glycomyces sp. NPDC048151]|uniref:DUF624 domain-containing protein n=1 Tax=Glycomyces sp. NPDC048151 TaxID=3364002 RepID=UPI003718346A